MKKNLFPLVLLPAVLLVACSPSGQSSSSDSEKGTDTNSGSSTPASSEVEKTADDVYGVIYDASKGNYTISYKRNGTDYYDLYTEKYVYFGTSQAGAIALPSYLEDGKELLYRYDFDGENVEIDGCLYSVVNETNVPDTSVGDSYEYLSLIRSPSSLVMASAIKTDDDGSFYSENLYLCAALGGAIGYGQAASYGVFDRVDFSFNDNGDLAYQLSIIDEYAEMVDPSTLAATICDVGTSAIPELDAYIKEVGVPEEQLSADAASSIFGEKLHVKSTIYYVSSSASNVSATMDYSFDSNHMHTVLTTASGSVDEQLMVKAEADGDGYVKNDAAIQRLNGENEVILLPTQRQWDTYDFPSDFAEEILKASRTADDGTYHYYGYEADDFVSSLLRVFFTDGSMNVASMDFVLKDGKVSQIKVAFMDTANSDGTDYFHYEALIEVLPFEEIKEIAAYQPIPEVTDKIQTSFDYLTGEGASYKVDAYNVAEKAKDPEGYDGLKVIVTPEVVLIEQKDLFAHTVTGYKKDGDKVIPFQVTGKGDDLAVRATGTSIAGPLSAYIPFTASASVFDINDKGQYVLRPNIVYVNKAIFSGPNGRLILPNTLAMDVDDQGRINKIAYEADMIGGSQPEQVDITDYGTAALPADIAAAVAALEPFVEPTSWTEENPDIQADLNTVLGSDASKVPYVYVPSMFGKLESTITGEANDVVHIASNDYNDFDSTAFVETYRALLVEAGFAKVAEAAGDKGDIYMKDGVQIEIGKQDFTGIYVSRYVTAA